MLSLILLLAMPLSFIGCGKSDRPAGQGSEPVVRVQFDGLDEGCKQAYDELFCPPSFKPNGLKAGKPSKWKYYILPKDDTVHRIPVDKPLPRWATVVVKMVDTNESLGGE